MEPNDIKTGSIIQASFLKEPIRVQSILPLSADYIQLVGVGIHSKQVIDKCVTKEDLKTITLSKAASFSEEAWKVFLAIEAVRYRYASLYDPLLAVNISKVDPLPHQIEAVYGYILKQPRIRFLIADDPGAGKTIMTGLLIKELKLRHLARRILIICPGHLKAQWQRELKEKFNENFEIVDRNRIDAAFRMNIWEEANQFITSIDFAKQDNVANSLRSTQFDFIIVDEAHKMSAYRYGTKIDKSQRYKLGEILSRITTHFLFLTATPHKGDPENFRLFLDLLEKGFFATKELIQQSIQNRDNPLFIRRIKEELQDFKGRPLFLPRYVKSIKFSLSNEEKELYNELSEYVSKEYNKAIQKDAKRNVAFALTILQRRLASSVYALLRSLERRKKKLEELLESSNNQRDSLEFDLEEIEDLEEEEREEIEHKWEMVSSSVDAFELKHEIQILGSLIQKAEHVILEEKEEKLTKLKESLEELKIQVKEIEKRKILIFTESKDTLEYLEKKLKGWGYSVTTIHEGLKLEERIQAEAEFRNNTEILLATEAAGEGINLQFCNLMINYDIPWNPNRIEQRIGRIHRYGQTREVFVHNLVATDTREGQVFQRLFEKLEEIKKALGDKVFDVLGEIIDSKQFIQALLDAAVNAKSINEILESIPLFQDTDYINKVKENLTETLATHFIDYTSIKEMSQKAKEYRLIPEYTQNFFLKAFEKLGGKISQNKDKTFQVQSLPFEIRKIAEEDSFKKNYGSILKTYPAITFSKEAFRQNPNLEFVSFGHPLFEAVLKWIESFGKIALYQGASFYDPDSKLDGYILFYEGEITDGTGAIVGKRVFSFFYTQEEVREIPPSILWDLKEMNEPSLSHDVDMDSLKQKGLSVVIQSLEKYKQEILQERKRQTAIKEKYGIQSLKYLIQNLDQELIELQIRKQKGEEVDLAIRNKEEKKKDYEQALKDLQTLLEQEKNLSMNTPNLLGGIRVIPYRNAETYSKSTEEIEEIERLGMEFVMKYEKQNGRNPEDVSQENLGYDIRSTDAQGNVRYIEVKSRAFEGDIQFTQNEWFKAIRFQNEYYLYVVFHLKTEPKLYTIQNPSENLKAEQKIELVRYLIKKEEIQK
ncbi:MAG: helicase-related protein [Leptospiraceae bacterium]|nr:helicase-related protein [Leptospiraceae bacterium]